MTTTKIEIEPYVCEYINGKFRDVELDVVRFPDKYEVYHMIYDLLEKRPSASRDNGNLEFMLPDRREANYCGGKSPEQFNYISCRGAAILEKRLRIMMWAELHEMMDENKHIRGIDFKTTVYLFLTKYSIESISEDALLKNYQRWRDSISRRSKKRGYTRKKC